VSKRKDISEMGQIKERITSQRVSTPSETLNSLYSYSSQFSYNINLRTLA